jgi:hypothetical protein
MMAPCETACRCNRTVHRLWPPQEGPVICDCCRFPAEDDGQLVLALDDSSPRAIGAMEVMTWRPIT